MTAIQIFGDRPFEMTPQRFEALADHQRAELVRLMAERGYGKAALVKILGQPVEQLTRLYRLQTAFRTVEFDRTLGDDFSPAKQGRTKRGALSARAERLLLLIARSGGRITRSFHALELDAGMSASAAKVAIGKLLERDLIERVATDARGRSTFVLTDKGGALADALAKAPEDIGEGGADA